ncbi:hypothetical protein niasHT_005104 [Heterodera trifolii]|uniref:Uncharacterized protein n=1 Tax=Heterodera trifolii TaxID=157864 RepID=A0ABD2MEP7_9BILA
MAPQLQFFAAFLSFFITYLLISSSAAVDSGDPWPCYKSIRYHRERWASQEMSEVAAHNGITDRKPGDQHVIQQCEGGKRTTGCQTITCYENATGKPIIVYNHCAPAIGGCHDNFTELCQEERGTRVCEICDKKVGDEPCNKNRIEMPPNRHVEMSSPKPMGANKISLPCAMLMLIVGVPLMQLALLLLFWY